MTALGTEFAMLMLISGNWHTLTKLRTTLDALGKDFVSGDIHSQNRRTRDAGRPHAVRPGCHLPGSARSRF